MRQACWPNSRSEGHSLVQNNNRNVILQGCCRITFMSHRSWDNLINVLRSTFLYKSHFGGFFLVTFWRKTHFRTKKLHIKCWWNWHLLIGMSSAVSPSLVVEMSWSPNRTWVEGDKMPTKQWAALRTCWFVIRVPPHITWTIRQDYD